MVMGFFADMRPFEAVMPLEGTRIEMAMRTEEA